MSKTPALKGLELYRKIRNEFIGLNTKYLLANGETKKRIYLDSTASTLMMKPAFDIMEKFLHHYANTHSEMHFDAKISSREYQWVHDKILSFLNADPNVYTCFFTGSGTTAAVNRMARVFRDIRPEKDVAIVSIMEHHSNDLPHRKHMKEVVHVPVEFNENQMLCVSLPLMEAELKKYGDRVNYVAVTGVSNVTGIINPLKKIAKLAHKYGALILVDGAQTAAHLPIEISNQDDPEASFDAFVFSGHKTYVPGSPGVVVAKKAHLLAIEPEEVGGGMVKEVFETEYEVKTEFPDREEAGTPNILGAIGLGAVIDVLDRIGMDVLEAEEDKIMAYALEKMNEVEGLVIYGSTCMKTCPRAASISFNLRDIDHGLVAGVLNDYFNIAVRNQCFCAHPYVKEMLVADMKLNSTFTDIKELKFSLGLKKGMVRASLGLYNTREDVDALVAALEHITKNIEFYQSQYIVNENETYVHKTFYFDHKTRFSISGALDDMFKK